MNLRHLISWAFLAAALPGSVIAAESLVLLPESTLSLSGDSTLHPFTATTQQMDLKTRLDPARGTLAGVLENGSLKQFDLSIAVETLKSKEAKLDKNMYKALKTEACPSIEFHMTSYEITGSTAQVQGTLKIACQEQPVTLTGALLTDAGVLSVQGKYDLKMTDYGVKPPTMMMGTIKVKNEVVINFDLRLR